MEVKQTKTAPQAQIELLNQQLEAERKARQNLEAAFKRLLFASDKLMKVLGPIISHFRGMGAKKGLASAGALPKIINQVMKMLNAESAQEIVDVAEKDIHPLITQYSTYYQQKEAKEAQNVSG